MMTFGPGRWRGQWIWAADAPPPSEAGRSVVLLRRDVYIDSVPNVVPARMTAVARYALVVNGSEVARGPLRASRAQPYDLVDLAPHLSSGANSICVLAWVYARATPWWKPPTVDPELAHGAFVFEARIADAWIVSDDSWSGRPVHGWTLTDAKGIQGRGNETLELSSLPEQWSDPTAEFAWAVAIVRHPAIPGEWGRPHPPSHPIGPLEPRPLTWPTPNAMPLACMAPGVWTTDEIVAGTVRIDIEGPAGASATVGVAERRDDAGRPSPSADDASFGVICDGSRRTIETLDAYGLSGTLVEADDGVQIHALDVIERLHPVRGDAYFRCSDERLDDVWAVGRRTVSLCSWDGYLDCPTREQRAWVGDAVVHQMVDLTTNADTTLARWYPRMCASPRADGLLPMAVAGDIEYGDRVGIPDWSLHWVHAVWNLYRYIGDREEIARLLPTAEGVLRWFERFCDGDGVLRDVLGAVLIDWASVYVDGVSSALCGLWGRALSEFAEMSEWVGDTGRATWARTRHVQLARGFEQLWDPDRRRYADVVVDGRLLPMASQHGQAAAIVGGLAPKTRLARLVEVLTDEVSLVHAAFSAPDGPALPNSGVEVGGSFVRNGRPDPWWDVDGQVVRAQPFFRYVVHDALVAAGRSDLLAAACLDWTIALERCATSWTETWYGGTICHGWSSTPTRDLITYVLGVQPARPGFTTASVEPALGCLEWAAGATTTPNGTLRVEASREHIVVDSPVPFTNSGRTYEAGKHTLAAR